MRISMIGTRGVPARYGGFETCVEEVGRRLVERGHEVTVYCRRQGSGEARLGEHLGMRLVRLPAVRHKIMETLSHTGLSVEHAMFDKPDVAFVFNAGNAPFLPMLRLRGIPVATHVDGLEWKRAKWNGVGKVYYRKAEAMAVRWSDALIADAVGIQDYYTDRFAVPTEYIPYGAPILNNVGTDHLDDLGLAPREYHFLIARFEPENNIDLAIEGYLRSPAKHPLIVIGAAPYANKYTARINALAATHSGIRLLGSVWDQERINQLYAHALTYVHGHTVGGTNPSLLRAMGAAAPTLAYNVNFNREVLGDHGRYFRAPEELGTLLAQAEGNPAAEIERGQQQRTTLHRYDWELVTNKYEDLAASLAKARVPQRTRGIPVPSLAAKWGINPSVNVTRY